MTENKRFEIISVDYTNIDIPVYVVKYGDVCFAVYEDKEDVQKICELLNELNDDVVKGDLFKLTVAMAIQHRINWLKKQIWDNTDRIDELQCLKKELKL